MPRIARITAIKYPHHITQRGNNREEVFLMMRIGVFIWIRSKDTLSVIVLISGQLPTDESCSYSCGSRNGKFSISWCWGDKSGIHAVYQSEI